MSVKSLRESFNRSANGRAVCQRAFLQHGKVLGSKHDSQMLTFEGKLSTGVPFQVNSDWMPADAPLEAAIAVVVEKLLEANP